VRFSRYKRELAAAVAYALLLGVVAGLAPSFFSAANLRDLALNNAPALLVAVGMTMVILVGATMGAVNGVLVGWLRLPSIIVTLAMLVTWRDALRWVTGGEWVQHLPSKFQWFGLGQNVGQWLIVP